MAYLYHGSNKKVNGNFLIPHKSALFGGKKIVFATNELWMALYFIMQLHDRGVFVGYHNGIPFILETRPGALKQGINKGWIYLVEKKNFKTDKNVMRRVEFVSKIKAKIIKRIRIVNILKKLKTIKKLRIITFETMMKKIMK